MRALGASRTSVATGGILGANWARDPLWRNARAVPSLDLRFADNKSLTDAKTGASLVTFTRASTGTYVGSDGLLQSATTNEARFDHNPTTGESLGLLVEEARTNSIRNNTGVGAVAGTPGTLPTNWVQAALGAGLTSQVVGTGTQSGIAYIDIRVSGTAGDTVGWSVNFDASTAIAASSGQSWTGSVYLAIVGGSTSGTSSQYVRVLERNLVGSYVTESNTLWSAAGSVFSPASRISVTRASMGATTGFVQEGMYFNSVNGAAIDITLRIGLPQLEQGAFATSPILTSTATATRAADVANSTGSNFSSWYNVAEGSVFANYRSFATAAFPDVFNISDGTNPNRQQLFIDGSNGFTTFRELVSNVQQGITSQALALNAEARSASAYSSIGLVFTLNGLAPSANANATHPTGLNRLSIGSSAAGNVNYLNGTIKRLTYWPVRLSNTTLQQITQP